MEIDSEDFNSVFVVKVEESKPVETPITEVVTVAPLEPTLPHVEASPIDQEKPKPRRVLKKDAY